MPTNQLTLLVTQMNPILGNLDGLLVDSLPLAYKLGLVKSSVVPSGLILTESGGDPGEIFAALGSHFLMVEN